MILEDRQLLCMRGAKVVAACIFKKGGHFHRRHSHGCDQGQEAVKGSRAVLVSVKQSRTIQVQTW